MHIHFHSNRAGRSVKGGGVYLSVSTWDADGAAPQASQQHTFPCIDLCVVEWTQIIPVDSVKLKPIKVEWLEIRAAAVRC